MLIEFYVLSKRVLRYHFNGQCQNVHNESPIGFVLWGAHIHLCFICLGSLSAHIIKYSPVGTNANLMVPVVHKVVMFMVHT